MPDSFDNFLSLSVRLCGITRYDLVGTGYARQYFDKVTEIVGRDVVGRMLKTFAALPNPTSAALEAAILNHPEFGPLARNIMELWYQAVWFQMPPTWRENYGASPKDQTHVPFTYAYTESLLGPATGAHPAGAKPTGHQSWVLPPEYLPIPPECD